MKFEINTKVNSWGEVIFFMYRRLQNNTNLDIIDEKQCLPLSLLWGSSIKYVRKIFRKTNTSNPLICTRTCAYQGIEMLVLRKILRTYLMNGPMNNFPYMDYLRIFTRKYWPPLTFYGFLKISTLSMNTMKTKTQKTLGNKQETSSILLLFVCLFTRKNLLTWLKWIKLLEEFNCTKTITVITFNPSSDNSRIV